LAWKLKGLKHADEPISLAERSIAAGDCLRNKSGLVLCENEPGDDEIDAKGYALIG
jgi:hypothetical protein